MPEKGFEPPRGCPQVILSHPCLPFHHSGVTIQIIRAQAQGVNAARSKVVYRFLLACRSLGVLGETVELRDKVNVLRGYAGYGRACIRTYEVM